VVWNYSDEYKYDENNRCKLLSATVTIYISADGVTVLSFSGIDAVH